jgi:hypothetical protein
LITFREEPEKLKARLDLSHSCARILRLTGRASGATSPPLCSRGICRRPMPTTSIHLRSGPDDGCDRESTREAGCTDVEVPFGSATASSREPTNAPSVCRPIGSLPPERS